MAKLIALFAFIALVLHSFLAKAPTLATANLRMALALVFVVALIAAVRKDFENFIS